MSFYSKKEEDNLNYQFYIKSVINGESIAINQGPNVKKAINKCENMIHDSSFRTAYEAREKLLLDEKAKLAHAG